jgi:hypothetical protein
MLMREDEASARTSRRRRVVLSLLSFRLQELELFPLLLLVLIFESIDQDLVLEERGNATCGHRSRPMRNTWRLASS